MIKAILFDFDGTLSNRQMNAYLMYRDFLKPYFPDLNEIEFEAVLQDALTFDSAPQSGSRNPVTSDGIYRAIAESASTIYRYLVGELRSPLVGGGCAPAKRDRSRWIHSRSLAEAIHSQ